jgi:hypothetical protein
MPTIVELMATRAARPTASTAQTTGLLPHLRLQAPLSVLSEIAHLRMARLHRPQGELPSNQALTGGNPAP